MRINFPSSIAYFKNIQGNNINLSIKLSILPAESHRCVVFSGRNHLFMASTLRARAEAGGNANKWAAVCRHWIFRVMSSIHGHVLAIGLSQVQFSDANCFILNKLHAS